MILCYKCGGRTMVVNTIDNIRIRKCKSCGCQGTTEETWRAERKLDKQVLADQQEQTDKADPLYQAYLAHDEEMRDDRVVRKFWSKKPMTREEFHYAFPRWNAQLQGLVLRKLLPPTPPSAPVEPSPYPTRPYSSHNETFGEAFDEEMRAIDGQKDQD